ncbi:DNA-directed RNA polymerase subunit alpha [Trichonephila clavata]|uniref:DNA-directed RNA polymerase subunit alpha n=1 Tax=Trichonephila clavata TaxID=2740835 RepID=A0A8X6GM04_TRICU|nr:DNA-directed RNA polymerase subunit alpha [Trichonephila clavata]
MGFRIFSSIVLLAVAGATAGLLQKLTYPQFLVGKTHLYSFTVNMTAGIQGMRPQVSKAVLTGELKIYAKTKTDLILSMHNILVSKTLANISSSKDFVQVDPCPSLEDHMKIPIKCRYENGKVKSYTLCSNETLESKKIKRTILRNLELYLDKKVLRPPLVGRWPVSYNKTRKSAAGTYTSLYTITSSPNAKFPQDIIVYNISRTDNYENIPYDAYRTQHNFAKQGCPEVCERGRTDNKFAAGCPAGYESFQTPLKKSFFQQHDMKFAGGGVLIIDKVTTVEAHVADIYDQQMEIFISSVLKFKLVSLEKNSERHGQNVFTNLEDFSNEVEEEEISKLYGYSNLTQVEQMAKKLLQDFAEIVAKADLKSIDSNLLGEEIMILRKLLTFLKPLGLRHIEETVVKYNELPHASEVDKIKRQIWLDILPLIGTRESVSFIVNVIQENINKPQPGISLWEVSSLLGALPQNIYRISDKILLDLSRLLELISDREMPGFTVFYSASYSTLARVIHKACALSSEKTELEEEDENKSIVDELNLILLRLTPKANRKVKHTCPRTLVERFLGDVLRKLRHTKDSAKRIIYIQFLAQTGLQEALTHLLPYVFGRISGLSPSYVDYLKLVTVKSLHNMVALHPLDVQHIVLPVFFNRTEIHKVRMAAFSVFINTNPSLGILQEIVQKSWSEPSVEVGSFVTSTLETYGNSSLPCYQALAHRIKTVLPQAKRFARGYHRSKNFWWDIFDNKREFGISKHIAYGKSNESFIPSIMYSSLAYQDHSFTDLLYEYAITTQGLNAIDIWDFFLQMFDIPIAEPIPKYKEPLIFPKVNIPPRDQEFWRMTVHQKLYYTDLFYYFDAHDIRKQSFANFVMDYFRHYFPKDPKGVHKGHFVKLFMPSSYHAQAIGQALPYPLQFERDNVILVSLKLTAQQEKGKASNKLKLLIEPSAYFTTLYTHQIMNLRDRRNVGAYHESKRNYAYSIELGLAKESNGRFNLTYRFPSIPKQTYGFTSEAGTFEGIRILSNFSLMEMQVPIVTVPSRFKRKETKNYFGMPPVSMETLTENIMDGFEEFPKNIKEAIVKFIELYHNAGWRRKSVNITQLTAKDEWSANTTGSFAIQFKRIYPKTDLEPKKNVSEECNQEKKSCFKKSVPKNLNEYLKGKKNVKDALTNPVTDKISIQFQQMEKKKVISAVAVTLIYNHTLCNLMQEAVMDIEAKNHNMTKPLKVNVYFISEAADIANVFNYNDDSYGKAKSLGYVIMNFNESGPYADYALFLTAGFFNNELHEIIDKEQEFPLSKEFYLPETHQKCLEDVKKGNGYSKPCIKAIRDRSMFNSFGIIIYKNNTKEPPLVDFLLKKVAHFFKIPTNIQFMNASGFDDKSGMPVRVTYVDKFTDEPVIYVDVLDKKETPIVREKMRSSIPFPHSIFSFWESVLSRASNNSYPAICALMDKYVTTFDLKNYPLPTDAPACTYILAAHCMKTKRFAVLAKIDPHHPQSKEIHLHFGNDKIILTPAVKGLYDVKYNDKSFSVSYCYSAFLNEKQLISAHMIDQNLGILQIDARRAGVKIRYNGKNVQVEVSLLYKGELCGLCGDFNGETLREYRGVSGCLYSDSGDFAKSCAIGNCIKHSPKNPYICKGNAMYSDFLESSFDPENLDLDDIDELPLSAPTSTVRRNIVLPRDDKLCFSSEAFPICDDSLKQRETEVKVVGFVCYSKSDPEAKRLLDDSAKRILTELKSQKIDCTENVEVIISC